MLAGKKALVLKELEEGTGATIKASVCQDGRRSSLRIWFGDLDENSGPVAELTPYGLKGHKVTLSLGKSSKLVINQMRLAPDEHLQLARALIKSIKADGDAEVEGQNLSDWKIIGGDFRIVAKARNHTHIDEEVAVVATCHDIIVPMMGAMAELIGYSVVEEPNLQELSPPIFEGAIEEVVVHRRERNPRNRLLCIRAHGEVCTVCGLRPKTLYGPAGSIIEVHHLEPLAIATAPRPYDPLTDLVPLCPSCHRAVHTRRPVPFSIEELKALITRA